MTLIDRKEPSLEVTKTRPLTVSSVILSVVTKLLHKRMSAVFVSEGFLGLIQYGFWKQRSTTDCVFLLLAAIRKAKYNHWSTSIAFCTLQRHMILCVESCSKLINVGFGCKVWISSGQCILTTVSRLISCLACHPPYGSRKG